MKLPLAGIGYRSQVFFGGIAIHGFALALPIFMMQLYDRILPNNAVATLAWLTAAAVSALLLEAGLRTARQNWASWNAEKALFLARRTMVNQLLSTEVRPAESREAFVALRLLVQDSFQQRSFFLSDLPFGLLYLGLIALIHPYLCLTLIILGLVLTLFYRMIRPAYAEAMIEKEEGERLRESWMDATFRSMAELKALGAEEQLARHHRRIGERLRRIDSELTVLEKNKLAVTKLIEALAIFLPLILGGSFVIAGSLTVGALTACVLLARRALGPLMGLAERWFSEVDLQQARRRLFRAIGTGTLPAPTGTVKPGALPGGPLPLTFEQVILRRGFEAADLRDPDTFDLPAVVPDDDLMVLQVADVRFDPGARVWFPSDPAIPLTELFRALRGLNPFYSGELRLGDQPLSEVTEAELARAVCLVDDRTVLFPGTLLENLSSFDPGRREQALDLGSQLGLDAVVEGLDRGYETVVTDRLAAGLAPGVLQALGLARALAARPRLLILDGYDTALDPETRKRCLAVLRDRSPDLVLLYRGFDPDLKTWADWESLGTTGALGFRRVKR